MASAAASSATGVPGLQSCLVWLQNCFRFDEVEIYESLKVIFAPGKSTSIDLVNILRDGIVLCQMAIILSDGSVRRRDLERFKLITLNSVCIYRDNIMAFLGVCRSHFQIPSKSLFVPDDLIKRENVDRVISALSAFSLSPQIDQTRFPGFQMTDSLRIVLRHMTPRQTVSSELSQSIERLRCTIVDVYSDRQLDGANDEATYCSLVDAYVYADEDEGDGGSSANSNWMQLVRSERNYTDLLESLVAFYHGLDGPAQAEAELAFRCIPALLQLHERLLRQLEATARISAIEDRLRTVCECVAREKTNLCIVYRDYLLNMPLAAERAEELQKVRARSGDPLPQHRLKDLLLAPLQRVQRYPDIFKACRETRPAMEDLMEVCCYMQSYKENEAVAQVLDRVNSSIAGLEAGLSLREFGSLLMEGEVRLFRSFSRPDMGTITVYCFLVGNLLIVCSSNKGCKSGQLTCQFCVHLPETCQISAEEVARFPGLKDWQLVLCQPEGKFSVQGGTADDDLRYRLQLKSRRIQQAWLTALQRAKSVRYPPNHNSFGHLFLPHICLMPTQCRQCGRLVLVGYGFGYRCRVTGRVVHRDCIPSAPRQRLPNRPSQTGAATSSASPAAAAPATSTSKASRVVKQESAPAAAPVGAAYDDATTGWQGQMSRGAAWAKLLKAPIGTYLVRHSTRCGVLERILSYRSSSEAVRHRKIFETDGQFYLEVDMPKFVSIRQLLLHYCSPAGAAEGCLEVQLSRPAQQYS